jgi:hypothetical protein
MVGGECDAMLEISAKHPSTAALELHVPSSTSWRASSRRGFIFSIASALNGSSR